MDPGEFDKRVAVVRDVKTGRDAAGAPTTARQEIARPWAKVIYPGGREFLAGDGEATERRVVFRMYPLAGVDVGTVVVFKDVDHDVQDIRPFDDVIELHTVSKAPVAP
jgi:head-tail adaptor